MAIATVTSQQGGAVKAVPRLRGANKDVASCVASAPTPSPEGKAVSFIVALMDSSGPGPGPFSKVLRPQAKGGA